MTTQATTVQTVAVDGVGSTVMTDIVESPPGTFTREIRIFDDAGGLAAKQVFTLRISSTVKTAIELTAPAQVF